MRRSDLLPPPWADEKKKQTDIFPATRERERDTQTVRQYRGLNLERAASHRWIRRERARGQGEKPCAYRFK